MAPLDLARAPGGSDRPVPSSAHTWPDPFVSPTRSTARPPPMPNSNPPHSVHARVDLGYSESLIFRKGDLPCLLL